MSHLRRCCWLSHRYCVLSHWCRLLRLLLLLLLLLRLRRRDLVNCWVLLSKRKSERLQDHNICRTSARRIDVAAT